MAASGTPNVFDASDLYPDVLPCLYALKDDGYALGIAGNQPPSSERAIRDMNLPVDFIATSATMGAIKPSPEFFTRLVDASGFAADQIAYVGDRLDNDVLPARAAGMLPIFLRRGPWGIIHARWPQSDQAELVIDSLTDLPADLRSYANRF